MKSVTRLFKLVSDETRVRILMLLTRRELCVCQLMGVLGISQPLVSRNLSILNHAGFLNERREGKLVFYSIRQDLPPAAGKVVEILRNELNRDRTLIRDVRALADCSEFQKKTGKCDMKTFIAFMDNQRKKRAVSGKPKTQRAASLQ